MSDDGRSHFKLERDGVEIEISGDWSFVRRIYRQVMRDVDRATSTENETSSEERGRLDHVVWVIRCGELMRRIYMAESSDFAASPLREVLDFDDIGTLYIGKSAFDDLLPAVAEGEETLWARLTDRGREVLAEAEI